MYIWIHCYRERVLLNTVVVIMHCHLFLSLPPPLSSLSPLPTYSSNIGD